MSRKTPEGKVKAEIDTVLKRYPAYLVNPATWGMGESGHSDKLVCMFGHFIAIEAKAGRNRPTELQRGKLREVWAAGGSACVINENNLDALASLIDVLAEDYRAGKRSKAVVIQPDFVDIFQDIISLRSEDFPDD